MQIENNCGNMHGLKETAIIHEGIGKYPLWFETELMEKFPNRGKIPSPVWKFREIKLYECPLTWMTEETKKVMGLLFLEDNPVKIFEGTWLNQPQWYIEAIAIYKAERVENMRSKKSK